MPIRDMSYGTVVDMTDDPTVVSAAPAYLLGVYVNTVLSATALPIKDGDATKFVIPAGTIAGEQFDFRSVVFKTSLVIDTSGVDTGNITVMWCPAGS